MVSDDLSQENAKLALENISDKNKLGKINNATLYDGGGSPSMMYDGSVKREGGNLLSGALLVFDNEKACNNR
jgi:hypothetical protein